MDWKQVFKSIWRNAKPPPKLTGSQWADEYGVVVNGPAAGSRWVTRPPQKAILDAFTHPAIEVIVNKKSARIGWTSITGHVIGYNIHQYPSPIAMVQPTIEDGNNWSKEDLQPLIEQTPELRSRVSESKTRDSKSTITKKHYPGGILHTLGANSARGFRRISVRTMIFDEVDGYPATAGSEGDQITLGIRRTDDYYDRKIGIGSTPTDDGISRVQKEIETTSQGWFFVSCPECGEYHVRLFREPKKPLKLRGKKVPVAYLKWPKGKPEKAAWLCPSCDHLIGHEHNDEQLAGGFWKGEHWLYRNGRYRFLKGFEGRIGFNIWAGYGSSPNTTPAHMASEFLDVKEDPEKLKTFVNTVLGEVWVEPGVAIDEDSLQARAENYGAELPEGVLFLTAWADVQEDRIEYEVIGWNEHEESWSIDYQVLFGDTTQKPVWEELKLGFKQRYKFANGVELPISAMGVDSGYLQKIVFQWVKDFAYKHCYATRGSTSAAAPIIEDPLVRKMRLRKRRKGGQHPQMIGVFEAKTLLFRRLKVRKPGPGYCHFPAHYDREYYEMLTAEKLRTRYVKGFPKKEFYKIRPRNEVLDTRVGNQAVLYLANPKWKKWAEFVKAPAVKTVSSKPKRRGRRIISKGIKR